MLGREAVAKLVVVRTAGDASDRPIRELAGGAFVATLEDALRRGEVDVAVHSLKDLPTAESEDCTIAAIPPREDPRDVMVTATRGGLGRFRKVPASEPPARAAVRSFLRSVPTSISSISAETW